MPQDGSRTTKSTSKTKSMPKSTTPSALTLLRRAHSPETAKHVHADKFQHKLLQLQPSQSRTSSQPSKDARARRRAERNAKLVARGKRRRRKPQPLSAAEKRRLCIYDIPESERKYSIYEGLHKMWCRYVRDILLGWPQDGSSSRVSQRQSHVEPQQAGAKMASADFHGAELQVVRSRCVGRVGARGIVVKDTMFTFDIITKANKIKTIPKEHTVFRFEVPLVDHESDIKTTENDIEEGMEPGLEPKPLIFEIYGEHFKTRAPDRANKKFKMHIPDDL